MKKYISYIALMAGIAVPLHAMRRSIPRAIQPLNPLSLTKKILDFYRYSAGQSHGLISSNTSSNLLLPPPLGWH